jgi:LEA14-like dessication related protein
MPEYRKNLFAGLTTVLMIVALTLPACTWMRPGYDLPAVTLESFRALPSEGALPEFEIGLGIINPNREPLEVVGISYTISVAGHELVKGVGKGFDVIEGYDKGRISLKAGANLLAGIRLVTDLMVSSPEALDYEFKAKLDMGAFHRAIRIRESGQFRFGQDIREP